jgi:hypothetical protein
MKTMGGWFDREAGRSTLLKWTTTMFRTVEFEPAPVTDKLTDPAQFCRERLQAAADMARRGCRGDALAAQIEMAVEAVDLWEVAALRPRSIRAWRGWEGV